MPASIYFFKSDVRFRFSKQASIAKWVKTVVRKSGKKPGSINFIFCSDDYLLQINRDFLHHDYFTDIITFDYSERTTINGEIYISIDRVKENAGSLKLKFGDELNRVIIHGVLHLLGYSDYTETQKKQMRKKEDACLSLLHSST